MEIWRFEKRIALSEKNPPLGKNLPNFVYYYKIRLHYRDPKDGTRHLNVNIRFFRTNFWFCSHHISNIRCIYFREYLGRQLEKDVGGDAKLPIKAS